MQTRSRAKAQSLGSPVSPLEDSGLRPPSSASDKEGDLGLALRLGDGAVSDVGGGSISASAISESDNTTVVTAQAPVSEAKVATSLERVETTRLPATGTQAPIGSLQVTAPSSGGGGEPVYLSAPPHPLSGDGMAAARIPTQDKAYSLMVLELSCCRKNLR